MAKIETLEKQLGRARENMQIMIELNSLGHQMSDMIERQERAIENLKRRIMERTI